jgi:hypothetical protein
MIRVTALICFVLSLLCPVFCLAKTAGAGECSDCAQSTGENCEAMSVGAVVEKSDNHTQFQGHALPSFFDEPFSSSESAPGSRDWLRLGCWIRDHAKAPPSAARRHALLQSFLF